MDLLNSISEILSHLATVGVALAALYWFFFTRSFKQKIQLSIEMRVFQNRDPKYCLSEIILTVDNKGQREHRLYNLWCEARESRMNMAGDTPQYFLPAINLVPKAVEYYFVAAGVRQVYTRAFKLPTNTAIVRVTAMFTYDKRRLDIKRLDRETLEQLDNSGVVTHSVSQLLEVGGR
jgi:hypothetical protein